jgi:hypothetical protein
MQRTWASFTFSTVAMGNSLTAMPLDAAASDSPSGENAIECGFEQDGVLGKPGR